MVIIIMAIIIIMIIKCIIRITANLSKSMHDIICHRWSQNVLAELE